MIKKLSSKQQIQACLDIIPQLAYADPEAIAEIQFKLETDPEVDKKIKDLLYQYRDGAIRVTAREAGPGIPAVHQYFPKRKVEKLPDSPKPEEGPTLLPKVDNPSFNPGAGPRFGRVPSPKYPGGRVTKKEGSE